MKTIVLAYDESPEAGRALEKTVELAKVLSATVVVTSVAPVMHFAGRGIGPYDPADPPGRHRELAHDAVAILTEQGIVAKAVTALGEPGHTIVELADQEKAEMIVLGSGCVYVGGWGYDNVTGEDPSLLLIKYAR